MRRITKISITALSFLGCSSTTPLASDAGDASVVDASGDALDEAEASSNDGGTEAGWSITVLAANQQSATGIVVDSANLYWGAHNNLMTCPVAGCAGDASVFVTVAPSFIWDLAVDATNVYWTHASNYADAGDVSSCTKVGCNGATTLLGGQLGHPDQIAIDANNVYWTIEAVDTQGQMILGATSVMQCPLFGCTTPIVLATNQSPDNWGTHGLAVDDTQVYWANEVDGNIVSCSIGGCGGTPTPIITGELAPASVVVKGGTLFWGSILGGTVKKCALTDCTSTTTTLASGILHPASLFVDDTNVYWLSIPNQPTQTTPSAVMRCAVGGCNGAPTTLTTMLGQPFGLAVDATSVYWTDNAVMKLTPK